MTYLNDESEIRYGDDKLLEFIDKKILDPVSHAKKQQLQIFKEWFLKNGRQKRPSYVACFTARGDALSQWRGYCPGGAGVSIGVEPRSFRKSLAPSNRLVGLGRCLYEEDAQSKLLEELCDKLLTEMQNPAFKMLGFDHLARDIYRATLLLKHPAFHEEEEWRVVLPPAEILPAPTVNYREGASLLVPYIELQLPPDCEWLAKIVVGPTPRPDDSLRSIESYLRTHKRRALLGVSCSGIPYREW